MVACMSIFFRLSFHNTDIQDAEDFIISIYFVIYFSNIFYSDKLFINARFIYLVSTLYTIL